MIQSELVMKTVVTSAIDTLRNHKVYVAKLFDRVRHLGESGEDLWNRFLAFWEKKTPFPVYIGYPNEPTAAPGVYIVVGDSSESDSLALIGDAGWVTDVVAPDSHFYPGLETNEGAKTIGVSRNRAIGDRMEFKILINMTDRDLLSMVSHGIRSVILETKDLLENDWGLYDMRTSIKDVRHDKRLFPANTHTRSIGVTFDAYHELPSGALSGTTVNDEYSKRYAPLANRFAVSILDGDEQALIDPDGSLTFNEEVE